MASRGAALAERPDAELRRIATLEQQAGGSAAEAALWERQEAILQRVRALERAAVLSHLEPVSTAVSVAGACAPPPPPPWPPLAQAITSASPFSAHKMPRAAPPVPEGESDTYRRLHAELLRRGLSDFLFVRVAGPYYDRPLSFRASRVGALSTAHLCKTMVMENTRAPAHVVDCSNPKLSKYYMVLVQYEATIDAEKLRRFVHQVRPRVGAHSALETCAPHPYNPFPSTFNPSHLISSPPNPQIPNPLTFQLGNEVEKLPKVRVCMRMADEALSCELTGFGHNGVTPIGSATRVPIVVSHRIAQLPGRFFLGAGEVDLKVGVRAADFVRAFADVPVWVTDCTQS